MRAKVSILGFSLFFGVWIVSKVRSKYGFRYRDWKGLNIAKKMGIIYVLTIVFWIISIMFLKTDASLVILENSWPQWWITIFLIILVFMGFYMRKIRPGGGSLLSKIKGILVPIFMVLIIVGGFIWVTGFSFSIGNEESDIKHHDLEKDVFKAINEERRSHGLNSVTWDNRVAMVAREVRENLTDILNEGPLPPEDLNIHFPEPNRRESAVKYLEMWEEEDGRVMVDSENCWRIP